MKQVNTNGNGIFLENIVTFGRFLFSSSNVHLKRHNVRAKPLHFNTCCIKLILKKFDIIVGMRKSPVKHALKVFVRMACKLPMRCF